MRKYFIYCWLFSVISLAVMGQELVEKTESGSRNILLVSDYYGGGEVFDHRLPGQSLVKALDRAGYRVWILNWETVPAGFDSDDAVASVAGAVDKILAANPGTVALCGIGWGGTVAGNYAVMEPDKVERLILLDPVFTGLGKFDELPSAPAGALPEIWKELHVSGSVWLLNPGVLQVPALLVAKPVPTGRNASLEAIVLLPAGSELATAGASDAGVLGSRENIEIVLSSVESFLNKNLPLRSAGRSASPVVAAVSEYRITPPAEIATAKTEKLETPAPSQTEAAEVSVPVEVAKETPVEPAPAPVEVVKETPVEPSPAPVEVAKATPVEPTTSPVEVAKETPVEPAPPPEPVITEVVESEKTPSAPEMDQYQIEHEDWYNRYRAALALSDVHNCAGAAVLNGKVAPSRNAPSLLADRHAVIKLLREVSDVENAVLYLSDAPCAYCAGAIRYVGIDKIVIIGKVKANRGLLDELSAAGVEIGFLEK